MTSKDETRMTRRRPIGAAISVVATMAALALGVVVLPLRPLKAATEQTPTQPSPAPPDRARTDRPRDDGRIVGTVVLRPSFEITAINQPQADQATWGVRFRLANTLITRRTLSGWIDAVAYDSSDTAKARPITTQAYPIADLQARQAIEGDVVFTALPNSQKGFVELTYYDVADGQVSGRRSADGVLTEIPQNERAGLVAAGSARALATTVTDVALTTDADRLAAVFDFDTDSCYPSAAVSDEGIMNPGLEEQSPGLTWGCREASQLQTSHTYYRRVSITKNGNVFVAHMYALYFMMDKTVDTWIDAGHRHDWEFALIWTTNGTITHASHSSHGGVDTEPVAAVARDADGHVKFVYHKNGPSTHSMRFAGNQEQAENGSGQFFTPRLLNWRTMAIGVTPNTQLRQMFNSYNYDQANCSFNDYVFPEEVAKHPPASYPLAAEWKAAAKMP